MPNSCPPLWRSTVHPGRNRCSTQDLNCSRWRRSGGNHSRIDCSCTSAHVGSQHPRNTARVRDTLRCRQWNSTDSRSPHRCTGRNNTSRRSKRPARWGNTLLHMRHCRMGSSSSNHRAPAGQDIEPGLAWDRWLCDERRLRSIQVEMQAPLRPSSQAPLSATFAASFRTPGCELSDRNANRPYDSISRITSVASVRASGGQCRPDSSSRPRPSSLRPEGEKPAGNRVGPRSKSTDRGNTAVAGLHGLKDLVVHQQLIGEVGVIAIQPQVEQWSGGRSAEPIQ